MKMYSSSIRVPDDTSSISPQLEVNLDSDEQLSNQPSAELMFCEHQFCK